VVAIEANTCLAKCAAERFRTQISSGQLRILNIGIAAEEGELPFWICETHSEWSSFDRKIASRDGCPHHEVMVPCRRFDSVLEEFGVPHYLKVDIEGNDILCLQDLNPRRLPKFCLGRICKSRRNNADGREGVQALQSHKSVQFSPHRTPTLAGTAPV
jgi:FkbM family methyltransferase